MTHVLLGQARSFAAVGVVGFLIDGGIMTVLHSYLGLGIIAARLISFSCAVTATWYLNRRFTFATRHSAGAPGEWWRYALVNGMGALINMALFFWLVLSIDVFRHLPLAALAIAATAALVFNFFVSRRVAFQQERV